MQLRDRYDIVRPLGRGATAQTYLARERERGEQVAVKHIVLRGLGEWKSLELLQREAEVLRAVSHPGVVRFVDAFEVDEPDSGPGFVVVTAFVAGETLLEQIQRGRRFTATQARGLLRALLETLDHLHSLSPRVIHRDIKPANVILEPDDHPVLVDFGAVRAPAGGDAVPTAVGTAGYMAPEQALGVADPRADLHGLGATLVHAFTHVHPSELPREGLRPVLGDLTGLDAATRNVLVRMLEPDPVARFASAREALAALLHEHGSALAVIEPSSRRPGDEASTAALVHAEGPATLASLHATPRPVPAQLLAVLEARDRAHKPGASLAILGGSLLLAALVAIVTRSAALGTAVLVVGLVASFAAPQLRLGEARRLFETGAVALGSIRAAESGESLLVRFAFRHDGGTHEGRLEVRDALVARRVDEHTPVFVFFDPAQPERHVAVLGPEWTPPP